MFLTQGLPAKCETDHFTGCVVRRPCHLPCSVPDDHDGVVEGDLEDRCTCSGMLADPGPG